MRKDKIRIERFPLSCFVGVPIEERRRKQTVLVSVALYLDLRGAGSSDDIKDTIDYARLAARMSEDTRKRRYSLIEALAEHLSVICLEDERVEAVDVKVEKKGALPCPVCVELRRSRGVHRRSGKAKKKGVEL